MKQLLNILLLLTGLAATAQPALEHKRDSLRQVIAGQKEDSNKVWTLEALARTYYFHEVTTGVPVADSMLRLATKLKWAKGIVRADIVLGTLVLDSGNLYHSNVYFQQAIDMSRHEKDSVELVRALGELSRAYNLESNYPTALQTGLEAWSIVSAIGNDSLVAGVCSDIAIAYLNNGDETNGLIWVTRVKIAAEKVHSNGDLADALTSLAFISYNRKNKPEARRLLRQALALAVPLNEPVTEAGILSQLGEAERDSSLVAAIAHLRQVRTIFAAVSPHTVHMADGLSQLAQAFSDLAEQYNDARSFPLLDSAIRIEKTAIDILLGTSNKRTLYHAYTRLARFYSLNSEYDKAYAFDLKSAAIYDSLYSQKNKERMVAMQSQHELELKEKAIVLHKLEVASQRKTLIGLGIGLMLAGLLGALLYQQNQRRKKNNATLSLLNHQLDEANKVKAKFFGILSHDLRGPIANLLSFLQLVKDDPEILSEAEQREQEYRIARSAEELLENMESMLLWSKEQMQTFQPNLRLVPVQQLFDYLSKFFSNTAVPIRFINPSGLSVSTDENYLRVIMQNLTSNAIKALGDTPGGAIEWNAEQKGGKTVLSITDNGPGVTAAQAKALLADVPAINARTGFGFHLIRDLARAIQVTIHIEPAPEKGTRFVLA